MPDAAGPTGFGPAGRALMTACKIAAVAGGLVFVALVAMSIVSIVGRKLWSVPVPGDLELMQMGAAVGSSAFFAYCHLVRGDVKVDFFTQHLKASRVAMLDAIGSLLVGLFGALIAWRTTVGAISLYGDGETSAILGWPIWLAQGLMIPGFVLLAAAGFYMSWHFAGKARNGSLA
jgi:TRAP-type mannitol/chloroaromatic compound transport system permease small subunit